LPEEVIGRAGGRERQVDEEHGADEVAGEVEVAVRVVRSLRGRLGDADRADNGGVLLQADEVVEQRRDDAPDRLRQDDVPQRLHVRSEERRVGKEWRCRGWAAYNRRKTSSCVSGEDGGIACRTERWCIGKHSTNTVATT